MANFFFLSLLLLLGATSSSGEMSPVDYWNKLLPKTPIPDSLHAFFPTDSHDPSQRKQATAIRDCVIKFYYHRYKYAATLDQLKEDREVNFLFLKENLRPGSKTREMDFVQEEKETNGWPPLLPREEAQAIPFSTSKLGDVLKHLSIDPNSTDATIVKLTLEDCEGEANKGETRYCATSLESMVDFAVSQLKTNDVQLLTYSFANKEETKPKKKTYTVLPGVVELPSQNAVVCHIQSYPYAVFYCHKPANTRSYVVPLLAEEDGSRVNAGAVCHMGTSSWNPNHAIILGLGIKPGTPACHFLSQGHFVWVSNSA